MSQKFKKLQNKNDESTAYGKWFATAVYDQRFITTEELAEFIQTQASVKKSDIKAVLDELGGALKHFFELGPTVSASSRSASARSVLPPRTVVALPTSPPAVCCSSPRASVSWSVRR